MQVPKKNRTNSLYTFPAFLCQNLCEFRPAKGFPFIVAEIFSLRFCSSSTVLHVPDFNFNLEEISNNLSSVSLVKPLFQAG